MNDHLPVAAEPAAASIPRAPRVEDAFVTLARLERLGGLDLALLGLAAAQWWLLWREHFPAERTFDWVVAHRLPFALPLLMLAAWIVLAVGALAPLARRPRRSRLQLPLGAGLMLAAYALMGLAWFTIALNTDPDGLWGFWHLARLSVDEAIPLAVLPPLVLAPGWRRLARAARLAWLRRRRSPSRVPGGLARRASATALRLPHGLVFAGLAGALAWLFTDNAVNPDGFGIVAFANSPQALGPLAYREPGAHLLLQLAVRLMRPLGIGPGDAIRLTSFLFTLGALGLMGRLIRRLELGRRQRRAAWLLIFASLGVTQMLFGHVEFYPLVVLSIAATTVAAVGVAAFGDSPVPLVLVYALGLFGHLSLIFLLPAVLVALACWTRPPGPAARPRTPLRAAAHLFGWGALVHLPLWGLLMGWLERPTPLALVRAVLDSLNTGGQSAAEARNGLTPTLARRLGALFMPANDFKLVQILFYLACGALLVGVLIVVARLSGAWRPLGAPDRRWRRQMAVLGAAFLGYLLYAFAWRNDYPWSQDWDLFSGVAPVAALLALRALLPARGAWSLPPRLVTQVCLFAIALGATQHYYYHRYATYLTEYGKIKIDRRFGPAIQRYQFQHGWLRYHAYTVEGGRVVARPIVGSPAAPSGGTEPGGGGGAGHE